MASFDAMAHSWTIRFLEHRIADKRILRLIAKWLKVGITEDGRVEVGFGSRPCENARDRRTECVRSDTGEDLTDRRGEISRIEPCEL